MALRVEVVVTPEKIDSEFSISRKPKFNYIVEKSKGKSDAIYVGDLLKINGFTEYLQICGFYRISPDQSGHYVYNGQRLNKLNYEQIIRNGKIINNKTSKKMKSNKMMSTFMDNFKRQFLPELDNNLRISMNGQVCAPKNGQYVAIDANNELVSYPTEFTMEMPVYLISKQADNVQVGDVIRDGNTTYSKITEVKRDENGTVQEFKALSFSGSGKTVKPIKDFVLGQKTLMVVVNLFNGFTGGQINPMFMLLADKDADEGNDMLMMLIAMQAMNPTNNGIMNNMNPMMLMMLMGGGNDGDFFKNMMIMNMMGGANGNNAMNMFGNMFGNMGEAMQNTPKQPLND